MKTKTNVKHIFIIFILVLSLSACSWFKAKDYTETLNEIDSWHDEDEAGGNSAPSSGQPGNAENAAEERSSAGDESAPMEAAEPSSLEAGKAPIMADPSISSVEAEDTGYDYGFFEDYGVNPFVDTDDDNLSTFATDVDTGSYTIARNYINDGILPPPESVRVEEFINFFPQNYRMPTKEQVFTIQIDGGPTPFTERDRYQMIRIGIQGYDVPDRERKDASLTFVIDVSGSMGNENRLAMVQDSLELLVDQLNASDTVSIVAYSDEAWLVLPPTSGRDKAEISEAIYSLYPMASTNVEAGLILGYEQANRSYISGGINRVILCSDGVANVGSTGPNSIWESIKDYAAEGINMTSIGVGMGSYNDVLMEQLADQGNGFYAYVDTMEEANRLFVYDLVSTLQVIGYDAKVQVTFNPEVVSDYRLVGFENRTIADEDFRDNSVDAAEIGAGHSITALYELKVFRGAVGEVATVNFRWQDPDDFQVKEISKTFDSRELPDRFSQTDLYFQMDVLVAEFAEILKESYWAERSSIGKVLDYAKDIGFDLERDEFFEFIELMEIAQQLY